MLLLPKPDFEVLPYSACLWGRTFIQLSFNFRESNNFHRFIVFSRRFMKWTATITMTFFNAHELAKIVLHKFYEILWCQIVPFGIAN